MSYQHLIVRTENRIGWLEYNRPPINAFNWEMLREVPAALESLLDEPQVRVVVFASAIEKYFNTGADIHVFDGIDIKGIGEWVTICHGLVTLMRKSQKPLLAAIRQTITEGGGMSFDDGLKLEFETAVNLADTKDFTEGIRAFLEKRKPEWE